MARRLGRLRPVLDRRRRGDALYADRLAHRERVGVMAAYFEHAVNLPMSFHASAHSGRLLKVMIEGSNAMFGVWLSFFREHCAGLVALSCCCR